jgi:hypothetical protein
VDDQKTLAGFFAQAVEDSVNCTPPEKLVRREDPDTSRAAAFSAKELRLRHNGLILRALLSSWDRGMTSEETADRLGLEHPQVWRRMSELARAGHIECLDEKRKNRSGRMAHVWRVALEWK